MCGLLIPSERCPSRGKGKGGFFSLFLSRSSVVERLCAYSIEVIVDSFGLGQLLGVLVELSWECRAEPLGAGDRRWCLFAALAVL